MPWFQRPTPHCIQRRFSDTMHWDERFLGLRFLVGSECAIRRNGDDSCNVLAVHFLIVVVGGKACVMELVMGSSPA